MAVRFILGRSGTGKTSLCIRQIKKALGEQQDGSSLIFLVPEQATYQAERAILSDRRIAGYSRLRVLSFDRLGFWLLGKRWSRPELSRLGREMLIHKILLDSRDRLKVFAQAGHTCGLAEKLAEVIVELHEYGSAAADVKMLSAEILKKQPESLTALKFADIADIFGRYAELLEGRFLNPEIQLTHACRSAAGADFLKGAHIWVDGFSGFTLQERHLLAEILKVSAEAHIALCLDPAAIDVKNPAPDTLDPYSLFSPAERTYTELFEMVRRCKLSMNEPVILADTHRFNKSCDLAHIERTIFTARPQKCGISANSVMIASAGDIRSEVVHAAGQIRALAVQNGFRYRDIAVIVSDMSAYEHYIRAAFSDYVIPFFIDRPISLRHHPVSELLRTALEAVINEFSTRDIIAYLKTGLGPLTAYECDLLENYCLAFGIRGGDWTQPQSWTFAVPADSFNQELIDSLRRKAVAPIVRLCERLTNPGKEAITAAQFTSAVFGLLSELDVQEKILGLSDENAVDEPVHRQFWDRIVGFFDEFTEVFGDDRLSVEGWFTVISNTFEKLSLKLIPPMLDQVLVGSIERSRHPELRAVFLLGATNRQFPEPVAFDSLLTDADRKAAHEHEFELSADTEQRLLQRQYLAYIAFTRPSERLYISYPLRDGQGKAAERSQFIDELCSLFTDLKETHISSVQTQVSRVLCGHELSDVLCQSLGSDSGDSGRPDAALWGLVERLCRCQDAALGKIGNDVSYALQYKNQALLDEGITAGLFRGPINCSATRLEGFAACPYKHFAGQILELKERKLFGLEPVDLGRFYHELLDGLFKRLRGEGKALADTDEDYLLSALDAQLARTLAGNAWLANFAARSLHNRFIINSAADVLRDFVPFLAQMAKAGDFRQEMSEVKFGFEKKDFLITLPAGAKANFQGCIDRVDTAVINGKRTAVIFDYKKRKNKGFSWSDLYYGLDMQLVIYMLALKGMDTPGGRIESVAGAFYLPVETSIDKGEIDDVVNEKAPSTQKAKGIFDGSIAANLDRVEKGRSNYYGFSVLTDSQSPYGNYAASSALKPDDFAAVLSFAERKIIELCDGFFSGRIEIKPYRIGGVSPCSRCIYHAVCKFDWLINEYNPLEYVNKIKALGKITGKNGSEED